MEVIQILEPSDIERIRTDPVFRDVGRYVEDVIVELLHRFVPPAYLYSNPVLWDSNSEENEGLEIADVLFWHESTLLLIECKGRELTRWDDLRNHKKLGR
jgi:hypothetical protein